MYYINILHIHLFKWIPIFLVIKTFIIVDTWFHGFANQKPIGNLRCIELFNLLFLQNLRNWY